jgi:hypothetical protein
MSLWNFSLCHHHDFSGINDTAEIISAGSLTPLKFGKKNSVVDVPMKFFTLQSPWFQRFNDTAEIISAVSLNWKWGLGNLKLFPASSTCIVWGYLPLKYFCWIFPLTEEKRPVKSVWDWHRWNSAKKFCSWCPYEIFQFAITMISAVSLTPLKPFQWCQLHCWNRFNGVSDTSEIRI